MTDREPRHVSDIITDVMYDPTISDDARKAIAQGIHERSRVDCPCADCMRAYLRSVRDG